jgi:hypothetical protein
MLSGTQVCEFLGIGFWALETAMIRNPSFVERLLVYPVELRSCEMHNDGHSEQLSVRSNKHQGPRGCVYIVAGSYSGYGWIAWPLMLLSQQHVQPAHIFAAVLMHASLF